MLENQHRWWPVAGHCFPESSASVVLHPNTFHSLHALFFFFWKSAVRYFKTYFEVFVWILQSFYPVYSFPDFIVFGSPGLLHAIPKPKKMVLFTRRQGQPWCFSSVQLSVGKFVIPTHTHFAVSHISCTGFPLAETVDTVGVKQLTYCTAARAERKWWTNYL